MVTQLKNTFVWMLVSIGCGDALWAAEVPRQVAAETAGLPRTAMPIAMNTDRDAPIETTGQREATSPASLGNRQAAEREPAKTPILPPRTAERPTAKGPSANRRSPTWIAGRVGIVLAVFLGLIVVQRLFAPRPRTAVTAGAIQVCGRVPLDNKQSLHLVRLGQRLLVLLESPQGMQRIAEITDPQEVRRLLEPSREDGPPFDSLNVGQVLAQFRHRERSVA